MLPTSVNAISESFLKGLGEIHERGIIYCESGPSRVYARYTLVSSKSGVVYESVYVRSLKLIFKFPNSVNMMWGVEKYAWARCIIKRLSFCEGDDRCVVCRSSGERRVNIVYKSIVDLTLRKGESATIKCFARINEIYMCNVEAPWLILPVVICLSQRLSHACLSTCRIKVKPRMAH